MRYLLLSSVFMFSNAFMLPVFRLVTSLQTGVKWPIVNEKCIPLDLQGAYEQSVNNTLQFPDYYLQPFHTYKQGNLGWRPPLELGAAEEAIFGLLGAAQARAMYSKLVLDYTQQHQQRRIDQILDVGCGTGTSARALRATFPSANITAIDLSPYHLAVALTNCTHNIAYSHQNAEQVGFDNESFDLVNICFTVHELPREAASRVIMEASRLLRKGGTICIVDMSCKGINLRNPVQRYLYKKVEPHFTDYRFWSSRAVKVLQSAAFVNVSDNDCDLLPHVRILMGWKSIGTARELVEKPLEYNKFLRATDGLGMLRAILLAVANSDLITVTLTLVCVFELLHLAKH